MFEDLVGKTFGFFGVDCNAFKLGGLVFEAIEDEDDGYRSYFTSVEVKDPTGLIFFKTEVAEVTVARYLDQDFDGYELVDVRDGHVWLRLGTDSSDQYYPMFTFRYWPKD